MPNPANRQPKGSYPIHSPCTDCTDPCSSQTIEKSVKISAAFSQSDSFIIAKRGLNRVTHVELPKVSYQEPVENSKRAIVLRSLKFLASISFNPEVDYVPIFLVGNALIIYS